MDCDYRKRGYLLPEGCKDLIDVIQPNTAITEEGFVVTIRLPGLQTGDINVVAEGSTLRIFGKQSGSPVPFGKTIEVAVPGDYALAQAQATYLHDWLRIVVPKAAACPSSPTS